MFSTDEIKRFLNIYTEDLEREEHSAGIDSILEKNGIGPIQSDKK